MSKAKRDKIAEKTVLLRGEAQIAFIDKYVRTLPLDDENPVEVVFREQKKQRKKTLNDLMWAGPLADIERDARHDGRQFPAVMWHEFFKEKFLPDEDAADFDPSHVIDVPVGYRKWRVNPFNGRRELVGSTTQLTDKGMRIYLLQMEAEAATEYGVTFTTPDEH